MSQKEIKTRYPILTVPRDAQFFVAIARVKEHNYVMAGYLEDNVHGQSVPHLLLAVGKMGASGCSKWIENRDLDPSDIRNEGLIYRLSGTRGLNFFQRVTREIDYKAYAVTYEQYCELIDHLKTIRAQSVEDDEDYKPHFYYQIKEDDTTRTFVYSKGQELDLSEYATQTVDHNHQQLNYATNDCRASAKAIVGAAGVEDSAVSSHWYGKLPNTLMPVETVGDVPEFVIHRRATDADMEHIIRYVDKLLTDKITALDSANQKHKTTVKTNKLESLRALHSELATGDDKLNSLRDFRQKAKQIRSDHWYLEFGFISGLTRGAQFPNADHKKRGLFTCETSLILDEIEDVLSGAYRVVDLPTA